MRACLNIYSCFLFSNGPFPKLPLTGNEGTCQDNCKDIVQYQAEVSDVKETVRTRNFALYCTFPDTGNVTFLRELIYYVTSASLVPKSLHSSVFEYAIMEG